MLFLPQANSASGEREGDSSFRNTKSAECPRAFGDYCTYNVKEQSWIVVLVSFASVS